MDFGPESPEQATRRRKFEKLFVIWTAIVAGVSLTVATVMRLMGVF